MLPFLNRIDPKYAPIFDGKSPEEQIAIARYFMPHTSKKDVLDFSRPRVIKFQCPFADQRSFPSGHRYSVNVYTGCGHGCEYCYVLGYAADMNPARKRDYRKMLLKDLDDLERYNVPAAPLHLSISTDAFGPLELEHGDTLFTLERLAFHKHRFTTIYLLTKNPYMLRLAPYFQALQELPSLKIGCSVAFFNDEMRQFMEPSAPTIESRLESIAFLAEQRIPVSLRIDPLFPRNPLPNGKSLEDFGLPDMQPLSCLESLILFCKKYDANVIYSVAKIVNPRFGNLSPKMSQMKKVYELLAGKLIFQGGSWRLPREIAEANISREFLQICQRHNVPCCHCIESLLAAS